MAEHKGLPPEAHALVAQLVQLSYNDYAATSQQLIENLQHQVAMLEVELDLIRGNVGKLANIPYAPNIGYILELLHPSRDEVKEIVDRDRAQSN